MFKFCTELGFWENSETGNLNSSHNTGGKTDYLKYCLTNSATTFREYDKEVKNLFFNLQITLNKDSLNYSRFYIY